MKKPNLTFAIIMIVLVRVSIGWQFLYEGLWKIDSQSSPKPWTSEGYLKNAQGPFRPFFRAMTGDPNDFNWLDYDHMSGRWTVWKDRFADHYNINPQQRARLDQMVDGFPDFREPLKQMPKGVKFDKALSRVIRYDKKKKELVVSGIFTRDYKQPRLRMLPRERNQLLALAKADNDTSKQYRTAIENLFKTASTRLSYKEKLAASLVGNPERAGLVNERFKDTLDGKRPGEIEKYRKLVARYERDLANAKQTFNYEHLKNQYAELQKVRAEVIGPSKALEKKMQDAAKKLLIRSQLTAGPPSLPWAPIDWTNFLTIAGLTTLGLMLISGLFTRAAAIGGALMLLSFYLVMPPWPGVPPAPGPEHSLFVNKNLIEVLALIAIIGLPTGKWFGLDNFVERWMNRDEEDDTVDSGRTATTIGAPVELDATFDENSDADTNADSAVASETEK